MKFKLEQNYGTFGVFKIVEAADEEEAWEQTGIYMDLERAGWKVLDYEDAEWEVVEL